ncbi:MAG: type III-B CRISPR module RAMP protein Cmr6 [Chloroflexi bacterium]|nr:MAG: type III-B CRISPR module RAMP protein Cmr6 [Chloroflexota bacterium]
MSDYPLPLDTQSAIGSLNRCQNPGLLFDRYTAYRPGWSLKSDPRARTNPKYKALEVVRDTRMDATLHRHYVTRWQALVSAAGAAPFEAQTDWRFITGLGRKGPLEVGFTFHRIYGFPIIPGSGLKGLARAYAYFALLEAAPDSKAEENPDFIAIFGRAPERGEDESTASAGGAVFFEAIPLDNPDLELDIMNPHYPDYYTGQDAPTDGQNPKPVFFLTVKPGVRFAFAVGWRGEPNPEAHALAVEWLKKGLEKLGAGAKTGAGYGYWQSLGAARVPEQSAATTRPRPTAPTPSAGPLTWRRGKIVKIETSKKHKGSLMDIETEQVYHFHAIKEVIEGDTPGKNALVRYAVEEHEGKMKVVRVRKGR